MTDKHRKRETDQQRQTDTERERERERERDLITFNSINVIYIQISSFVTNYNRVGTSPRTQSKPRQESVNSVIVTIPPSTSRHVILYHSDGE